VADIAITDIRLVNIVLDDIYVAILAIIERIVRIAEIDCIYYEIKWKCQRCTWIRD